MKKAILFGILTILIMLPFAASALYFPLPINGRITSDNAAYQAIEVKNSRTGVTVIDKTNGAGEFLIEWANTDDNGGAIYKYMVGDTFTIRILSCVDYSDKCTVSVTYTGQSEIFNAFDLTGITLEKECPPQPSCGTCSCGGGGGTSFYCSPEMLKEKCPQVLECETCTTPICPDDQECDVVCETIEPCTVWDDSTTPYAECNSCCDTVTCEEYVCETDEEKNASIAWIIGTIVSIFFAVAGLVLGGYTWFPGIKGLSNYYIKQGLELIKAGKYAEGKKKMEQGFKMMKTSVERAKEGQYEEED